MPDTGHTLILGVGNPLMADDGIGVLAVQHLLSRTDLPPHVTVVDGGTDGFGLIALASLTPMIFVLLFGIIVL